MIQPETLGNLQSLRHIPAEAFLSAYILLVLLLSFFKRKSLRDTALYYVLGIVGVLGTLILEASMKPLNGSGQYLFYGMLSDDGPAHVFKLLLIASSLLFLIFSYSSRETTGKFRNTLEYVILVLANTLSMMLLAGSSNLLMMYLSLEFLSLTSYMLTAVVDRDARTSEAGIKYLLYGAIASGVMVYGLSLLYGAAGTLEYKAIALALSTNGASSLILYISVILIITGLGFKIAAFPFHAWSPDVYEGAPTPVTAYLSVGSKAAGFILLVRFFFQVFALPGPEGSVIPLQAVDWSLIIAVMSALTMTYGNLAALMQTNIKRMLAYSSIAHAGYVLMAVAAQNSFSLTAIYFYLSVYFLMNFGAFLVVILVSNEFHSEMINDYEGLAWKSSKGAFLAAMFAVYLFSLTGVPPFAGFIGKLYLLMSVFIKGSSLYWLAAVAVANTVVSFYYYARILRLMFFSRRQKGPHFTGMDTASYLQYSLAAGIALLTIYLGIYWSPLDRLSRAAANFL